MNNYKKLSIAITILTIIITMFLLLNINIRDKELRKLQVEIDSLKETIYLKETEDLNNEWYRKRHKIYRRND